MRESTKKVLAAGELLGKDILGRNLRKRDCVLCRLTSLGKHSRGIADGSAAPHDRRANGSARRPSAAAPALTRPPPAPAAVTQRPLRRPAGTAPALRHRARPSGAERTRTEPDGAERNRTRAERAAPAAAAAAQAPALTSAGTKGCGIY